MLPNFLKKHKDFIIYVFWGGAATVVNIGSFMFLVKLGWHYQSSNVIAWLLAVLVTYFSNKFLVFCTPFRGFSALMRELSSFLIIRLLALLLDLTIVWLGIKILHYNSFLVKVFDNVSVGIINYLISRWFIFVDKKS